MSADNTSFAEPPNLRPFLFLFRRRCSWNGNGAVRNPYALIEAIDGIGFLTADEVARKIGYDFAGAPRIRAGILHTLKEQAFTQGHTCLPIPKLLAEAEKILTVPSDRIGSEIGPLEKDGLIAVTDGLVSLKGY